MLPFNIPHLELIGPSTHSILAFEIGMSTMRVLFSDKPAESLFVTLLRQLAEIGVTALFQNRCDTNFFDVTPISSGVKTDVPARKPFDLFGPFGSGFIARLQHDFIRTRN
jgi:hypothetical protein